jgi:SpoVK/Ycf46/Vps4 family AAA+-type ATPase
LTVPQISRFARRVRPDQRRWNDIVLPPDKMQQLKQIEARMKHREQVLREWGFGKMLSRGKGLIALFTGPSGTGKTLAAEILAAQLRLDLFQIDLSGVVSKYIGETEENLSAIFDAAAEAHALLFFDECDALFGKRTTVNDAHDRYANIETGYLLQRVENYEGMVVLATNLQRNMDDAFTRRIHEIVEFPPPDETSRAEIFRAHLPDNATRVSDRELAFLARQFELTGGNIQNITLAAAFLAASDADREPKQIEMRDLVRATAAELRKEGRLCLQRDFGHHYKLLEPVAEAAELKAG